MTEPEPEPPKGTDLPGERVRKDQARAERCHHCGAVDDADGDHTCPCPSRDEDCTEHPAVTR